MDEEGLHDTDDETQGYVCVSADPRKSGSVKGGENFIITSKELRISLQVQCTEEDQTVWMTTTQTGFPTTATEGELYNDLDRAKWHVRVSKQSCNQSNHLMLWDVRTTNFFLLLFLFYFLKKLEKYDLRRPKVSKDSLTS